MVNLPKLDAPGSMTVETIAKETSTKVETLYVLLRALAHLGVFIEKPGRVFAATELSEHLITNAEPSLGHFLMHIRTLAEIFCDKVGDLLIPELLKTHPVS